MNKRVQGAYYHTSASRRQISHLCVQDVPSIVEINKKERRKILEEVRWGFAEQADSQTEVCWSLMYYFFVRNLEAI